MKLLLTVRVALRALGKNKLRAGLTVLGVVIGVGAVTTMVSVGQSANHLLQSELETLGTNVIVVTSGSRRHGGVHRGAGVMPTLTAKDAEALADQCPSLMAVTPIVGTREQVIYGNTNWAPDSVLGVNEEYVVAANWGIRLGGCFTDQEIRSAAKVCVIGQTLVEKLFQTTDPIGKKIRIKNIPFVVIGVLEAKGANLAGDDRDNFVLAPYTTVRKRLRGSNFDNVDFIFTSARSPSRMQQAEHEIRQVLLERHGIGPGDKSDFEVHNTEEIAKILDTVTNIMTTLLAAIAGISLLVGGVGIMNIMLVSVTERTREIGIRMAVGAREKDIRRQFLVESVVLSTMGGIVGLGLGIGASAGITAIIDTMTSGSEWKVIISFKAAALAILFSAAVGVTFGYYPARRASRLDPIEALRYE
ncbi:MAG: ABC transporter permease [Planctomycetota bacterium]|jgi:putative ABC transport system permease protein